MIQSVEHAAWSCVEIKDITITTVFLVSEWKIIFRAILINKADAEPKFPQFQYVNLVSDPTNIDVSHVRTYYGIRNYTNAISLILGIDKLYC